MMRREKSFSLIFSLPNSPCSPFHGTHLSLCCMKTYEAEDIWSRAVKPTRELTCRIFSSPRQAEVPYCLSPSRKIRESQVKPEEKPAQMFDRFWYVFLPNSIVLFITNLSSLLTNLAVENLVYYFQIPLWNSITMKTELTWEYKIFCNQRLTSCKRPPQCSF